MSKERFSTADGRRRIIGLLCYPCASDTGGGGVSRVATPLYLAVLGRDKLHRRVKTRFGGGGIRPEWVEEDTWSSAGSG